MGLDERGIWTFIPNSGGHVRTPTQNALGSMPVTRDDQFVTRTLGTFACLSTGPLSSAM